MVELKKEAVKDVTTLSKTCLLYTSYIRQRMWRKPKILSKAEKKALRPI